MSPWPLIEVAIEPKSASDANLLHASLSGLVDQMQISFTLDKESGGFLLGGKSKIRSSMLARSKSHTGNYSCGQFVSITFTNVSLAQRASLHECSSTSRPFGPA
jgi:hypothetical protein